MRGDAVPPNRQNYQIWASYATRNCA